MFPNPEFARLVDEERRADARRVQEQARTLRVAKPQQPSAAEPAPLEAAAQSSALPASLQPQCRAQTQVEPTSLVEWLRVWASLLKEASS